jgi:hypothetical protein
VGKEVREHRVAFLPACGTKLRRSSHRRASLATLARPPAAGVPQKPCSSLLCGGAGADLIRGKGGDDTLRGDRGGDELRGGGGSNRWRGGGSDRKRSC